MKFAAAAVALFVALAAAQQPSFTNSNYPVESGVSITLTWANTNGEPVSIFLKNGPQGDLQTVAEIDSNDSGNSFTWTPPADLASGTYAFEIVDSSGSNFSPQFTYTGNPSGTLGLTGASSIASSTTGSSSSGSSPTPTSTGTKSNSSSGTVTSTKSSSSGTSTSSSSSSSSSASSTKPANSNDGPQLASSPLAFVLVTIAALVYVN